MRVSPVLLQRMATTEKNRMRVQQAYYSVFALKDGTVYLALPVRKPRKTKYSSAPKIDEEGVCNWNIEREVVPKDLPDWAKGAWHAAVSTCLNVKRIVREQVAQRLDRVDQQVQELRQQLDRLEHKIDSLLSNQAR